MNKFESNDAVLKHLNPATSRGQNRIHRICSITNCM